MLKNKKIISVIIGIVIFIIVAVCIIVMSPKDKDTKKKPSASNSSSSTTQSNKDIKIGSAEVVFAAADESAADEKTLNECASIIEERLMDFYIIDFETEVDASAKTIKLNFAWETDEKDFNANNIAKELCKNNKVMIRKSDKATTDSKLPAGEEVLSGKDIESAEDVVFVQTDNTRVYKVKIKFNEEGAEKLKTVTSEIADSDSSLYFWLDNTMLGSQSYSESDSSGEYLISTSFKTSEEAFGLANTIENGELPIELLINSFNESK